MRAYYLSPEKEAMYSNWIDYAQEKLLPHTQTCPHCSMILEMRYMSDLENNLRTYNVVDSNGERRPVTNVLIQCPGCRSHTVFTGMSHLPASVQEELRARIVRANSLGDSMVSGKERFDENMEIARKFGIILLGVIAVTVFFVMYFMFIV